MKVARAALIAVAGLLVALPANAAQFVYPLQGQGPAKQSSDESDCSQLAAQQLGLDPTTRSTFHPDGAPTGTAGDASASVPIGTGLQGGPAGALGGGGPGRVGTATDALVHNAGGVAGREGSTAGRDVASAAAPSGFDKARAACLTARGYSVH